MENEKTIPKNIGYPTEATICDKGSKLSFLQAALTKVRSAQHQVFVKRRIHFDQAWPPVLGGAIELLKDKPW